MVGNAITEAVINPHLAYFITNDDTLRYFFPYSWCFLVHSNLNPILQAAHPFPP